MRFQFFLTKLANTDFVQETARKLNTCIVRMEGVVSRTSVNDADDDAADIVALDEQFELEIPCPKAAIYEGVCSNDECRWECDDCGQLVVIHKQADVS